MTPIATLLGFAEAPLESWTRRFPESPAVAVIGPMIPDEVILAQGFSPVRLLADALPTSSASASGFPGFACPVSRIVAGAGVSGALDQFASVVVAQHCDALQATADAISVARRTTLHFLPVPQRTDGDAALEFFVVALRRCFDALGSAAGATESAAAGAAGRAAEGHPPGDAPSPAEADPAALHAAMRAAETRRRLLRRLYAVSRSFTFGEFYGILRGLSLCPYDLGTELLKQVLDEARPERPGPSVVLSGTHLPNRTLLAALDEAGFAPAGDLLDAGWCGIEGDESAGAVAVGHEQDAEGWERIAERTLSRTPPPGKHSSRTDRSTDLSALLHRVQARGVVFYRHPFCDPVGFDVAALAPALAEAHIPRIAVEYGGESDGGRIATRLEAFAEMIGEHR